MCKTKDLNYIGNPGVSFSLNNGQRLFSDECMVPLIKALNDAGFRTLASCCGHGKLSPTIIFDPISVDVLDNTSGGPDWEKISVKQVRLEVTNE
jgi:hypothetical protein